MKPNYKSRMFGCVALIVAMSLGPWAIARGALSPIVTPLNWYWAPYNRWAWQHMRRVFPTAKISRGSGPVTPLPIAHRDILDTTYMDPVRHKEISVGQMLEGTNTDGFIVLQNGKVVDEQYFHGMTPATQHIYMSMTKSVVGTLTGILVGQGKINPNALVVHYLPDLKDTIYGMATVRQVLDMEVSSTTIMSKDCPPAGYCDDQSAGWTPPGPNTAPGLRAFVLTLKKQDFPDGAQFQYVDTNPIVMSWVIEKVENEDFTTVVSNNIWSKLGAEHDANMVLDHYQTGYTSAGFDATLRDTARFAEMMLDDGYYNGQQIVPHKWVKDIMHGGNERVFKAGQHYKRKALAPDYVFNSYRSYWWIANHTCGDTYVADGLGGQLIVIDPAAHIAIVKLSSDPNNPPDGNTERRPTASPLAGIHAIIRALSGHGC